MGKNNRVRGVGGGGPGSGAGGASKRRNRRSDDEPSSPVESGTSQVTQRSSSSSATRTNGSRQGSSVGSGGSRPRSQGHRNRPVDIERNAGLANRNVSRVIFIRRILSVTALVGAVAFVAYYGFLGYQQTRVHTPFSADKIIQKFGHDVPERFWGTYRPGVYFGMKHRSPKAIVTGLMWLIPPTKHTEGPQMRHLCSQDDRLRRYGWIEHDGANFGVQEIVDRRVEITTSFVKRPGGDKGGDWTSRIEVKQPKPKHAQDNADEMVLFYYVARESSNAGRLMPEYNKNGFLGDVVGDSSDLGDFRIHFETESEYLAASTHSTKLKSLNDISKMALSKVEVKAQSGRQIFMMTQKDQEMENPDIIVKMIHIKGNFTLDVAFESASFYDRPGRLSGTAYTELLSYFRKEFKKKFEGKFHLTDKGFNSTHIKFAQAALSNMVGGIGYFYGHSRVMGPHQTNPVAYWNAALYTAVPSRSFFPRGFLWDEGFHLLLINKWNPEISIDIISHWLDLMNTEGWIPREQILGEEALSRVPEEFVVQRNDVANPPTLIMGLFDLIERHRHWLMHNERETLTRMWPRLQSWYQWLNRTQAGDEPTTFRWRGRNDTTLRELNPKTLASGLDDYPRASHPTTGERHLDLRCWMAISAKLMAELASILDLEHDYEKYVLDYNTLTNPELLDKLHWSEELQSYTDYGLHSDNVALQYPPPNPNQRQQQNREKIRYVLAPPKYGFVNVFGYNNLFPLSLQILSPDSPKLITILEKLENIKELWSPYGLRSLSASAPLYQKRNTEHDPPYWRGAVWININFLTLKALNSYAQVHSPAGNLAQAIYGKLRQNIINNVFNEYYKTGYVWEQYDDTTGQGKGCRPFTGWSALVVLIMSEEY